MPLGCDRRAAAALAWLLVPLACPEHRAAAAEAPSSVGVLDVGAPEGDAGGDTDGAEVPPELELSLELASAYVFRGYNVFQEQRQREQKMVQRPRFIWSPPRSGFSLGYAGANQLSGANLAENVAAGLGAEQDLLANYDFRRDSPVGLAAELTLVAYPAAAKKVAGTTVPLSASAATELRYLRSSFIYLGYLHAVRHGPLPEGYFYLNPRVDKRSDLGHGLELEMEIGAGIKWFPGATPAVRDNMVDVLASATLYYAVSDVIYIGAKLGWAWTNLRPFHDADTGQRLTPRFADEYVPFWSLTIGTEISGGGDAPSSPGLSRQRLHAL